MKKWLFTGVLCLLLFLSGCRPEGIIPPGEMETLFAEFYLADACIETVNAEEGSPLFRPDSLRVYQPLIEKHGFTEDEFRASLAYYLHRPSDFSKMFKHVRVRLEQEADRPVDWVDTEDAEDVGEEIELEEKDGAVTKHPRGIVKEGVEPELEREPEDLPEVKLEKKPEPKQDPNPKPSRKRKRMTKEDLKRLEEELK